MILSDSFKGTLTSLEAGQAMKNGILKAVSYDIDVMAIADGGELIVLAPGVTKFGEDTHIDTLIRKYGYCGRLKVLELFKKHEDLQKNMGAAAHLIHSSSDGRFNITYAVKHVTEEEVKGVHFNAANYDEVIKTYNPDVLEPGWNTLSNGEEVFFIPNPALGLWIDKNRF